MTTMTRYEQNAFVQSLGNNNYINRRTSRELQNVVRND